MPAARQGSAGGQETPGAEARQGSAEDRKRPPRRPAIGRRR
jgi:hypothetical protein